MSRKKRTIHKRHKSSNYKLTCLPFSLLFQVSFPFREDEMVQTATKASFLDDPLQKQEGVS